MINVVGQDNLWNKAFLKLLNKPAKSTGFTVDTTLAAAELASSGVGFALLSSVFAQSYLESGKLVQPIKFEINMERFHYLLLLAAKPMPLSEVMIFRDWLLATNWSGTEL
ncbi:MAG: DNA-binding transcriptional LysR family regulator [Gammaproteobacteria bacterium]|jgi:DNA-binding transcriptional LysR family regulator